MSLPPPDPTGQHQANGDTRTTPTVPRRSGDDGRPAGQIEIAGQRYLTAEVTAALFGITVRTLGRWHAARIGPPKTKVGKLVLYNVERLPEWLASQETQPVRTVGRRR